MFGKGEGSALVSLILKLQLAGGFAESGICGWTTGGLILQPSAEPAAWPGSSSELLPVRRALLLSKHSPPSVRMMCRIHRGRGDILHNHIIFF